MERDNIEFWIEPYSWALPLRIGCWKSFAFFEIQVGPFGMTWKYSHEDLR